MDTLKRIVRVAQGHVAMANARAWAGPLLLGFLLAVPVVQAADKLETNFAAPPDECRPWCYWWWMNGIANREGITRDFEEMRKAGVGGALLFDCARIPEKPLGPKFMSEEWRELFRYSVREAARCGVTLNVNLCSGWNVGGPWVTSEHAAKKLVASTTVVVQGPGRVNIVLPKPEMKHNFYQDVAVLAAPISEEASLAYRLSASSQLEDNAPALALDGASQTCWISNGNKPGMGPTPERPEFLQFDFESPTAVSGVCLKAGRQNGPRTFEIQASDDGKAFRKITEASLRGADVNPSQMATIGFAETNAKHFRVVFLSSLPPPGQQSSNVQVAEIELMSKAQVDRGLPHERFLWNRAKAVDVTRFVSPDGQLTWDAPAGRWKLLRLGMTLYGRGISFPGSGPGGLEIDPMSAEAMDFHFAETGAKLIADAGDQAGKALQYFHIDSWEMGQPTWTPRLRQEFQRRRGYDPLDCLPGYLGEPVAETADQNRFDQDFRRTIADLVAVNYYGRLDELAVKGGLRGTHPESGGPYYGHWIDPLQCLGQTAVPMGEFWQRDWEPDGTYTWTLDPSPIKVIFAGANPSLKQAASAAHIYGKPVCQAESFTAISCDWAVDPWCLKDTGDRAFCHGLTRMVFHKWETQLHPEWRPGIKNTHIGTDFNYGVSWWPMSQGWLRYLARCQYMLRQGLFVADFAYLQSEATGFIPVRSAQQPIRPAGFDYDAINAEALITRASAKDGRLTLSDGMSYRYLVLPHDPKAILWPATLKKVNELAQAGVTVIGPKALAVAVPGLREGELDAIVKADRLAPDIEFREPSKGARFDWIHRRDKETDIYFISNQKAEEAGANIAFRVLGKRPELWDPVTGKIRDLTEYAQTEDGRTEVPIRFAPRQSWFVVFRERIQNSEFSIQNRRENFPELKPVQELAGSWEVQFDEKWFYPDNGTGGKVCFERLEDWSKRSEDAVKYYSGIANYRKVFDCQLSTANGALYVDLGVVKNLARVKLNGRELGIVWTAPWRVEIPEGLLKAGGNELEIEVVNLWPNRLMGDDLLPKEKRRTVTNVSTWSMTGRVQSTCPKCKERRAAEKNELLPSGLLGPVRVMGAQ